MTEGHDHSHEDFHRAFAIGFCLNVAFVVLEAVFGILAGSLALLADAGHNLSDVAGLALAWGASSLMKRRPTQRRTYGWKRSSIIAAMMNAILLFMVVGGIALEAVQRLQNPERVAGWTVFWVAGAGVLINTATALLFLSGRREDLNIRAAFLHMAADAGVSAGVVLAGLAIMLTNWLWLDPVVSLAVSAVILVSTWGLLTQSFNLALDAVPAHIDPEAVKQYLSGLPGVTAVHDFHVWGLSTTETALTAHIVKPEAKGDDALLNRAGRELQERFGIRHITLQWEREENSYQCDATSCLLPEDPQGK